MQLIIEKGYIKSLSHITHCWCQFYFVSTATIIDYSELDITLLKIYRYMAHLIRLNDHLLLLLYDFLKIHKTWWYIDSKDTPCYAIMYTCDICTGFLQNKEGHNNKTPSIKKAISTKIMISVTTLLSVIHKLSQNAITT